MAQVLHLLRSATQSWSLLGGRVMTTRRYSLGRSTKESFMYTDVIVKRGLDTIRICVVPTKTSNKVKPHMYGVTKGLRVIAHDNNDPIDTLDNLYIEKIVQAYSPFLTHPEVKIHYTLSSAPSTVVKTIQANVATLGFIQRGLPGQPDGYTVEIMESRDGVPLEDMSAPPPDVVYVIGSVQQ